MDQRPAAPPREQPPAGGRRRAPLRRPRWSVTGEAVKLRLARLVLDFEGLWRALWQPAALVLLFLALAWIGLFALLSPWLHVPLLLGFLGAVGYTAWRGLRTFRPATVEAARRRLETDSRLAHRPLSQLQDGIAGGAGDPLAHALWREAQARARRQLGHLRLDGPQPGIAARDPWALRSIAVLLLAVGVTVGWGDLGGRLGAALFPSVGMGGVVAPSSVEAWVTPPDYTGQAPIFLTRLPAPAEGAEPARVAIPHGSTLTARLNGGYGTPKLIANDEEQRFQPVEGGGWQMELALREGDRVAIRQGGRELAGWEVQIVPDMPPGIAFRTAPSATERQALRIDYTAGDDYGIKSAKAILTLGIEVPETIDTSPMELALPVPGRGARQTVNGTAFHDLTGHPWAGLPVKISLIAEDGAGQKGESGERGFTLPEREFHHPVARAIIAQRKALLLIGEPAREPAARELNEISARPGSYNGDPVAFLALRSAVGRLALNREPDSIPSTVAMLWDVALRIEDGGLSLAERDLRTAQQELMDALDRDAPDAEVEQAMQRLEQAMQQFMDALERQAMEQGQQGAPPEGPADPNTQVMSREDVERMVQQMREMAQAGGRDAARQMLSQLQQMMENLQNGAPPPPQTAEDAARQEAMRQLGQQLQDVQRQQQQLMDETFQQSHRDNPSLEELLENNQMPGFGLPNRQNRRPDGQQQGQGQQGQPQPGQQSQPGQGQGDDPNGMAATAERQDALRRQLGDLMRQLGELGGDIPRPLGNAERAMRDAQQALEQGSSRQALAAQGEALEQLQQSLQNMQQQMARQQGQAGGQRSQAGRQPGRDPLGRPLPGNGSLNGEEVKIPAEGEMQRAREILEELRRRAGEPGRPKLERDYIDRLLDRFHRP